MSSPYHRQKPVPAQHQPVEPKPLLDLSQVDPKAIADKAKSIWRQFKQNLTS